MNKLPVPTIHDVAAHVGVSIRTVSRVMNNSPKVNDKTRSAVLAAIDALGFMPNARARALSSGRSYLIGMIQGDANAHVVGAFQKGIAEACNDLGYELVVHPISIEDPELVQNIRDFVRRSRVDGVIILSPASEKHLLPNALRYLGIPAVAFAARELPGYPAMLVVNERQATMEVARHFHDLGHRRIGLVTGPTSRLSSTERTAGFVQVLADHGVLIDPDLVYEGDYSFESGLHAAEKLLGAQTPPSAIFACNDNMAAAIVKIATSRGLRIPEDLAIAGFDDSDVASMISPSLTTVRRPSEQMGARATELLIKMILGEMPMDEPFIEIIQPDLIVRGSTTPN
jgi:LacI family transcriptional regulator